MEKKGRGRPTNLTCSDICSIIKCCQEEKVDTFELNGLTIRFRDGKERKKPLELKEEEEATLGEIAKAIVNTEASIKEDELARMAIEDPEQYEELIMREDIIDKEE